MDCIPGKMHEELVNGGEAGGEASGGGTGDSVALVAASFSLLLNKVSLNADRS